MGGRISRVRRTAEAPAADKPAGKPDCKDGGPAVRVVLHAEGSTVRVVLLAPRTFTTSIPEDDLLVRVQLQASFSPASAGAGPVHLILLPTHKQAAGALSHDVVEWMGTPRAETEEAAHEAESPRSPRNRSRLGGKLSPRLKAVSVAAQ